MESRSQGSIREALAQVREWLALYETSVVADRSSRRSIDRVFLVRDILTTSYVYLGAMADYVEHGGRFLRTTTSLRTSGATTATTANTAT